LKVQSLGYIWRRIEVWIVICLFLLLPNDIALPQSLRTGINALAYIIVIPLILGCWKRCLYLGTRDLTLILPHIIAISSIVWTVAPSTTSDSIRGLIRTTLIGIYLAARYSPLEITQLFARIFTLAGFFSYIAIFLFPSHGIKPSNADGVLGWAGIYTFKLGLGSAMSLAAILALLNTLHGKNNRLLSLIGFFLAVTLIIFSKSSTCIIALVAGLFILPLYSISKQQYKFRVLMFMTGLLLSIAVAALVAINFELIMVEVLGKEPTLTGRLPLWQAIIDQASERPWLGHGYGRAMWNSIYGLQAIRKNPLGWPSVNDDISKFHSHNAFLEIFTQIGGIGLSLFLINYVIVLWRLSSLVLSTKKAEYFWMIQSTIVMTVAGFTDGNWILEANQTAWMLYVSFCLSSALQQERIRKLFSHRKWGVGIPSHSL
jgi:O-antigen ligase